jgi:molybdopterin-containing oxidoreductase family membrane subunit
MLRDLLHFLRDGLKACLHGSWRYHLSMGLLTAVCAAGAFAYGVQLHGGLAVTGMNDVVSWGLYISNFTFLVGLAAASVMLVLPAYILHDFDFRKAVLIGEGVAVAALVMCLGFVTVDLGRPDRFWHLIPFVGYFNFPNSMLTWDVLVLWGYLGLNLLIPFYLLFMRYRDRHPDKRIYVPFIILSVFWAVSIHLVTAFLYAGLPARPWWNSALLGPRFLASAFAAGPAFIILVLAFIRKFSAHEVKDVTLGKLALITTVAAQANLVMLGSELFKEFYHPTEHSESAVYLFFGLHGHDALVPWIRFAVGLNILCTILLTLNPVRRRLAALYPICALLFLAIWIEKGMGLIVPGFLPGPLGQMREYHPSWVEILISAGIFSFGLFVLTLLIKVALPVELGLARASRHRPAPRP